MQVRAHATPASACSALQEPSRHGPSRVVLLPTPPARGQVFRTIAATPGKEFLLRMSMMEIYNEVGWGWGGDQR